MKLGAVAARVGVRAKRIREDAGITQAEMVRRLRPLMTWNPTWPRQSNVSKVEAGYHGIDIDTAIAFATALGVPFSQLTGEIEIPRAEAAPPLDPLWPSLEKALASSVGRDLLEAVLETLSKLPETHLAGELTPAPQPARPGRVGRTRRHG